VVHFCGLGDSRIYLLPDAGDGQMLTVDDSMAQLLIAGGTPRAEAEASKQAHSITRWLGKDSAEIVPRVGQVRVTGPGWLLACSDGLWNYASEPAALKEQIDAAGSDDPLAGRAAPRRVCERLGWAGQHRRRARSGRQEC
jgi:serine/threonine protein phosphatase PrpC